ncbi:hypothetical protein [Rhodobacteraceae bacterium DSL-40]|uniref:hypothetical protein n=1 Tax=Amaricoccus sp. B4 TaxID=3368557 RepID=UPI000DAD46B5
MRSFSDLKDAVRSGAVPLRGAQSALAHLDLAEKLLGAGFYTGPVPASEAEFDAMFPQEPDANLLVHFGTRGFYRRWRSAMKRLCILAELWPADPFILLCQIASLEGIGPIEKCVFRRHFPGQSPKDVTRQLALDADRDLRGMARNQLRRTVANLDRLRAVPVVRTRGLLPPEQIGPFPRYLGGDRIRIELPEYFTEACACDPKLNLAHVRRAYEISLDLEILQAGEAMPPGGFTADVARKFHTEAATRISPASAGLYLRALVRALRTVDSVRVLDDLGVKSILRPDQPRKKVVKDEGKAKRSASAPSPLPYGIETILEFYQSARSRPRKHMTTLRGVLRQILQQNSGDMNEALESIAVADLDVLFPDLLPSSRRNLRGMLKAFLAFAGHTDPWDDLRDLAKKQGLTTQQLKGITTLRRYARSASQPLTPGEFTRKTVLQWCGDAREAGRRADAQKIRQGCLALDRLRPFAPNLLRPEPIGQMDDLRRRGNPLLPTSLEQMLEQHAAQAGFTKLGTKALLVAVRKLHACSRDRTRFHGPLNADLIRRQLTESVQDHPEEMAPYRTELARLAERLDMRWSDGWRQLQAAVVSAGIARSDNPVEELARVAVPAGLEPWQVDREWAWLHERGLRPDLRLTWARKIARFDDLGANEIIAATELLPPIMLGPMPPRGTRLKNAVYPLPAPVETAAAGCDKPLLEAMHFVWRCARDLGIWERCDAPDARALFDERVLDDVESRQDKMTPQSAQLHLNRIRDWREGRIDLSK